MHQLLSQRLFMTYLKYQRGSAVHPIKNTYTYVSAKYIKAKSGRYYQCWLLWLTRVMIDSCYDWLVWWLTRVMINSCDDWLVRWLTRVMIDSYDDWLVWWLTRVMIDSCDDWLVRWLTRVMIDSCDDWLVWWLTRGIIDSWDYCHMCRFHTSRTYMLCSPGFS